MKPAFWRAGFQFCFAEAQPLVGVEVAALLQNRCWSKVEDHNAAAGAEDSEGLLDGPLGVQGVMERLGEKSQIDLSVFDGKLLHVAKAEFDVFDAMAESLFAAHLDHVG